MEVTTAHDHESHAILGSQGIMKMKVSNSQNLIRALSSMLYSTPLLSAIREVVSNAYDAHVRAGIPNKHIEITYANKELIIRDFGSGIPADKVEDLYLTYGGSDKTGDADQIGGFGLGCKAPFALADHFRMANFRDGTKTIYALSKGSVDSDGESYGTIMAQAPTTETGVEVTIPVGDQDGVEILKVLEYLRIACGFPLSVNGVPVHVQHAKDIPFYFINAREIPFYHNSVFVSCGKVIYPLDDNDKYTGEFQKLTSDLLSFNRMFQRSNYALVMVLPPNTVIPTPSRESLNYNPKTIQHVLDAIKNTRMILNQLKEKAKVSPEITEKIHSYIRNPANLPVLWDLDFAHDWNMVITNVLGKTVSFVDTGKPVQTYFSNSKSLIEIFSNIKLNTNRDKYSYKGTIKAVLNQASANPNFYKKTATAKGLVYMNATNALADAGYAFKDCYYHYGTGSKRLIQSFHDMSSDGYPDRILSSVAIITTFIHKYKMFGSVIPPHLKEGSKNIILIPKGSDSAEHAKKLKAIGYLQVFDLEAAIIAYRESQKKKAPFYTPKPKVKRDPGLPLLDLVHKSRGYTGPLQIAEYTKDYKYVLQYYDGSANSTKVFRWGNSYVQEILNLFPNQIGVVRSATQFEAEVKKGKIPFNTHLIQVLKEAALHPEMKTRLYIERHDLFDKIKNITPFLTPKMERVFSLPFTNPDTLLNTLMIMVQNLVQNRYGISRELMPDTGEWQKLDLAFTEAPVHPQALFLKRIFGFHGYHELQADLNEYSEQLSNVTDKAAKDYCASVLHAKRMQLAAIIDYCKNTPEEDQKKWLRSM